MSIIWSYLELLGIIVLESAPYLIIGLILAGFIRAFLPQTFLIRHLGRHSLGSAFKAALFGIPLPLCSCGVLPTAVSLYRQGASLSATFAFLVATPQTSIDAILLAYGLLGSIFAIAYPISALFGALLTSIALVIFVKHKPLSLGFSCTFCNEETNQAYSFRKKAAFGLQYAVKELFGEIAKPLFIGFLAAPLVALLLPQNFVESLSAYGFTYLAMLIIGLPVYVCATASIPLGYAFLIKGFSPGSVLVFLIAGPATNLATLSVLSHVFGKKITGIYLIALILAALLSGMIFDRLVGEIRVPELTLESEAYGLWHYLSAAILLLMFINHYFHRTAAKQISRIFKRT